MNTANSRKKYIPAASHDWLLPFYDPFVKLLGAEGLGKSSSIGQRFSRGFGSSTSLCGTGSFAILIKRLHPAVDVIGLDPDRKALVRAKRKAERALISIRLNQGFA